MPKLLKTDDAIQRWQAMKRDGARWRAAQEALWAFAMLYDTGSQWGYIAPAGTLQALRSLRSNVDPDSDSCRVVMNKIHEVIVRLKSTISPQAIEAYCRPQSGSSGNQIVAQVGDDLMQKHLGHIDGLACLREMNRVRFVLGSAVVRRTLAQRGQPVYAPDNTPIRSLSVGWSLCYPWEINRDPSSCSLRPDRDEIIYGHEKARSVEWIQRNFGVKVDTECTLGKLMNYQQQAQVAGRGSTGQFIGDSKLKGVLVHEVYYQDGESELPWSSMLMGYVDPAKGGDELIPLTKGVVANPFHGLPFHQFNYDTALQAPWGLGVPHLLMSKQDVLNLAWTWLVRVMQAGAGKLAYEEGTIENTRVLNNNLNLALPWRRNKGSPQLSGPPTRLQPPQISPASMQIIGSVPQWMNQAVSMEDIQFGRPAGKHGESGDALDIRLSEANGPLDDLRKDDELELDRLLTATFFDQVRNLRLDTARALLGEGTPDEHIRALLRQDPAAAISMVKVMPSTLQPRTPGETRTAFVSLVTAQIITPEAARLEMLLQGRVNVDTLLANNIRKQTTEIDAMLSGQDVVPAMGDRHDYHILGCDLLIGSDRWLALPEEGRGRIQYHRALHDLALRTQAQTQAQPGGPPGAGMPAQAAGTPPAEAMEAAAEAPAELAGSAIQVA